MSDSRSTFVILTHNRRDELLRTLAQLCNAGPIPTIVVDNASSDGTAQAVEERFPHVEVIRPAHNAGAAGRNYGVRAAHTPDVAFCDDDAWWQSRSVQLAAGVLDRHSQIAVVNARVLIGQNNREDPTCTRMALSAFSNAPDLPGFQLFGFLAGACMIRRAAFVAAGGYHPLFFLGGEEDLLAIDLMSAGWKMTYLPEIIVHHHPSSVRDVAGRRRMLARNAIWCAWMRRPWRSAIAQTWRSLITARRERTLRRVVAATFGGVPAALRERRVVSHDVEAKFLLRETAVDARERGMQCVDGTRST